MFDLSLEAVHDGGMSESATTRRYLTVDETAQVLGVSSSTVRRWVKQELIHSVRYGRQWKPGEGRGGAIRIPATEVDSRLAA